MAYDPWFRNGLIRSAIGTALHEAMVADPMVHMFGEGCGMKVHFDAPQIERDFPDRVHTLPICVPGDTIILGDNRSISDLPESAEVFGADGRLNRVVAQMRRSYCGPMLTIKARYLPAVRCTPEHPIAVVRREKLKFNCGVFRPVKNQSVERDWVPAEDVAVGDYLMVPRLRSWDAPSPIDLTMYSKNGNNGRVLREFPLTVDTAWLLGLYVAEGSTNKADSNFIVTFSLNENEREFVERITQVVAGLGNGYRARTYKAPESRGVNVHVGCAALGRAFHDWCGSGARNKRIPDFIMCAPTDLRIAFLRGLFDGDGCRVPGGIQFTTSSRLLALQTQLLLAALGCLPHVHHRKPATATLKSGRMIRAGESWVLGSRSPDAATIFGYKYNVEPQRNYVVTDDYLLTPVLSKRTGTFDGDVFNIETAGNTYLVSNAVVHNCEDANTNFAVGASLLGVRPVVDVITSDFLYRTMDAIANTAAKLNTVLAKGETPKTILIRAEFLTAGPTTGARPEGLFAHIPGVNVAVPSTPRDAWGLTHAALTTPGVTLLFEDRMILDATTKPEDKLDAAPLGVVPLGKAAMRRAFHDPKLTIVTYGLMRQVVEMALDGKDVPVDLIDLRSLYPIDWATIRTSLYASGRLLVVEPDVRYGGVGAEIVAWVAENMRDVRVLPRLGGRRITLPAAASLHHFGMPTQEEIWDAIG